MSETAIHNGIRRVTRSLDFRGVPRLLYATREWVLGKELGVFELEDGIRMVLDPGDYFQCMMYYSRFCPEIRWWRSRPRMRLYPADASLQVDCELVCTPSELLAIGAPEPSSELQHVITRD